MDHPEHRPLCLIELVAERRTTRCPGASCPLWLGSCLLDRIQSEIEGSPDTAGLLLRLRRRLAALGADADVPALAD